MFSLQDRSDGLVDCARTILSQFVRLQNSSLLSVTDESDVFAQFLLQDEVRERSMTLLIRLNPTRFSEVSHIRIVRVLHNLFKRSIIPETKLKQYALSNLHGIINALCAWEDNGLKNDHPLRVPLFSTNPVKFYRQNPHKSLPDFPRRRVVALGWHTNEFFPPCLPLTAFRNSSIQVVSWNLLHPILVDIIKHVFGA